MALWKDPTAKETHPGGGEAAPAAPELRAVERSPAPMVRLRRTRRVAQRSAVRRKNR